MRHPCFTNEQVGGLVLGQVEVEYAHDMNELIFCFAGNARLHVILAPGYEPYLCRPGYALVCGKNITRPVVIEDGEADTKE